MKCLYCGSEMSTGVITCLNPDCPEKKFRNKPKVKLEHLKLVNEENHKLIEAIEKFRRR